MEAIKKIMPKVQFITKEELDKKMKENKVQVVNVLAKKHYGLGLIKGSFKIPLDELENRSVELDKSKMIVTYCAGTECNASKLAAEKLIYKGFEACAYEGGIKEWKESGLPVEE